jgi:hypothetical protein
MRYNLVCMHWVVERLDEILERIEDVGVEDLRGELVYQMGVRAHETWKDNGRGKEDDEWEG